jgi:predicted xylose isomerase-like sugar epimerase
MEMLCDERVAASIHDDMRMNSSRIESMQERGYGGLVTFMHTMSMTTDDMRNSRHAATRF